MSFCGGGYSCPSDCLVHFRFIRIEYQIISQFFCCLIQKEIFTYCDSFSSHREPSSDCDLDLVTSRALEYCLPLDWFLVVNKRPVECGRSCQDHFSGAVLELGVVVVVGINYVRSCAFALVSQTQRLQNL